MSLISTEYLALQRQLHEERADYGTSSGKYIAQVEALSKQLNTRDILDYGCGKALLAKGLPFPIQSYDPAIAQYNRKPEPAALVVCTDVLEHIEPAYLDAVLVDLARLTKQVLFLDVACRPAKKVLADGRNAHLIQQTPSWWVGKLLVHLDLVNFQASEGAFVAIMAPRVEAASA